MSDNPLPVRSPLQMLQLEFPHYRIEPRAIGGQLFYLAEAADPHAQPRFAQAESIVRLRAKLRVPLREFTASEPSIARVWDFLLGGKDNFTADRVQADALLDICPALGVLARQARRFQVRSVAHVARQGVRQFIDIGCGLPTAPNTHETAQHAQPGAVVAYVDNDELVLAHARALLATTPSVLAVPGDLAWPSEILYDWRIRQLIDFTEPVCLILAMILHFFDAATARRIVAQLTGGLPPGSYIIVCTGQLDGAAARRFTAEYEAARTWHHSPADLAGILSGLHLTGPGITEARQWPDPAPAASGFSGPSSRCHGQVWAAVAQKATGQAIPCSIPDGP